MIERCFQFPFPRDRPGDHFTSPLIWSSIIHVWTAASVRVAVLLTCKYPEVFPRLFWGSWNTRTRNTGTKVSCSKNTGTRNSTHENTGTRKNFQQWINTGTRKVGSIIVSVTQLCVRRRRNSATIFRLDLSFYIANRTVIRAATISTRSVPFLGWNLSYTQCQPYCLEWF